MEVGAIRSRQECEVWPKLPLSPIETKLWMETRTLLLVNQSCFADVWFRMMQDKDKELAWFTDQIPIAATDDRYMFLNSKTYFKYKLLHRVFISCHEICHAIFNHCGMMYAYRKAGFITYADGFRLPFDMNICQVSTDCMINDMLIHGKVGEMPCDEKGKRIGHHGEAGITFEDDIASAYRKYFEKLFGKGKRGVEQYSKSKKQGSTPSKGQGFDEHLEPGQGSGKTPTEAQDERNPQAWDNAVTAAIAAAKAQGKLPAALERGLSKLLEPKIDWRDQLEFEVSRRLGTDFSTWETLDNELMLRGIGSPSKARFGCGTVVFATDSSGSIDQKTCDMFNTEGVGFMEQARPRSLVYMQCDAEIHECVEIDDPSDLVRPIKGGGGTDFRPVFDKIERDGIEPDLLIYLTDLEGAFPRQAPPYPVIWATIKDHPVPFGSRVMIPKQIGE